MKTLAKLWISMLLLGTVSCTLPNLSPGGGGLDVKLEMAKAPALNEPVVLTTTVTAVQDTTARVYLNFFSAKVEIVNGPAEWQGTLKKGVPVQFSTTLRFVEEREHIVDALASGTAGMHGGASIRVYVTRTGGTFTIPVPTSGPRPLPTQPTPTSKIVPVSIYHQRSALLRLDIPDTGEWIAATTDIADAPTDATTTKLRLKYRVIHPKPEELEVRLFHPQSGRATLVWDKRSATGGEIFEAALEVHEFDGLPVNGIWQLQTRDTTGGNTGILETWTVQVHYETKMEVPSSVDRVLEMQGPLGQASPPWAVTADPSKDRTNKATPTPESPNTTPAPQSAQESWTVIATEGFEGVFPGVGWTVQDLSADGYERYWDDDNFRAQSGAWGAWPARGGADRLVPLFGDNYANNMDTRMSYGPVNLSGAIDATVDFWLWLRTEAGYDTICVEISFDGGFFWQLPDACWSGDAQFWQHKVIPLVGHVGQTIWLAWRFQSDGSVTYGGPWLDGISIQKREPQNVTVHGRWTYSDRRGGQRPARFAIVNLYDYNYNNEGGFTTFLGSTTTDGSGNWTIGPILNADPTGKRALDVYSELVLDGPHANVRRSSLLSDSYRFGGFSHGEIPDGDFDYPGDDYVPLSDQIGTRASWLFDDANTGWLYVNQQTGADPGGASFVYPDDSNFCCFPPDLYVKIDVRGALSPDVVIHELGHRQMLWLLKFPFPSNLCLSVHWLFSEEPDGRTCAWTEGWADFFAVAVNGDPCFDYDITEPHQRCEVQPNGEVWNFEMPVIVSPFPTGDRVEGRIAGALWDMLDPVATWSDGNADRYHGSFSQIWNTFMNAAYWSFEDFWNGWKSLGYDKHNVVIVIFDHAIDYDTKPLFVSPLLDAVLSSTGDQEHVVNLENYVYDPESSPAQLVYAISQVSSPNCVVSIDLAHRLRVRATTGWNGSCAVTVLVSDEIYPALSTFTVKVVPPRAYLPAIFNPSPANQPIQLNPYPGPAESSSTSRQPVRTPTPPARPYP